MSKKDREQKAKDRAKEVEENSKKRAKMRFGTDVFYNDLKKPKYVKGEVAEIVGGDMITRWMKRGAVVVDDKTPLGVPKAETPKTEPKVEAPKTPDEAPQEPEKQEPVEGDEEKVDDKPSKPAQAASQKNGKQQ